MAQCRVSALIRICSLRTCLLPPATGEKSCGDHESAMDRLLREGATAVSDGENRRCSLRVFMKVLKYRIPPVDYFVCSHSPDTKGILHVYNGAAVMQTRMPCRYRSSNVLYISWYCAFTHSCKTLYLEISMGFHKIGNLFVMTNSGDVSHVAIRQIRCHDLPQSILNFLPYSNPSSKILCILGTCWF